MENSTQANALKAKLQKMNDEQIDSYLEKAYILYNEYWGYYI